MPEIFTRFEEFLNEVKSRDDVIGRIRQFAELSGNGKIYIAGGAVRNILLDDYRKIKDLDIFIAGEVFTGFCSLLEQSGRIEVNPFGSFRWFSNKSDFSCDLIRIEGFYNGLWPCETIIDALNQFDITINALAVDLNSREFFDPQNGTLHIRQKKLRAVRFDYPEIMLSDDIPLPRNSILWFRYNHFSNILGFAMDYITRDWVDRNNWRIRDLELFRQLFFDPKL